MKCGCKEKLAAWLKEKIDVDVDVVALFDIHIKRIHEYKRHSRIFSMSSIATKS